MAKAKAPEWLREAFAAGVSFYAYTETPGGARARPAYLGANPYCWLAAHDPAERPCSPGPLERFHYVRRQDVEAAMWEQLRGAVVDEPCPYCEGGYVDDVEPECCGNTTSSGECRGDCAVPRQIQVPCRSCGGASTFRAPLLQGEGDDLILVAAWDPRNGGLGCEQHHRRYDNHQVSLPRERVIVPYSALPSRVVQFGFDYSEGRLLDRFPSSI